MYRTDTTDHREQWPNRAGIHYRVGASAWRYTAAPGHQWSVGNLKTITSWRGRKLKPRIRQLLHPHAVTIRTVSQNHTFVDRGELLFTERIGTYEAVYDSHGLVTNGIIRYKNLPGYGQQLPSLTPLEIREQKRATTAAYARMKSPKFEGATNLGELRETIKGILNPLSGVRSLLKRFRSRKQISRSTKKFSPKSVNEVARDMEDQWMEYRYGIMPVIYTIQDALDTFRMHPVLSSGYQIQPFHGGSKIEIPPQKVMRNDLASWVCPYYGCETTETTTRIGCSVVGQLAIDEGRMWGLRWADLPATAWELVTLSFVADWFWNIGTWIRAVTPDPKIRVRASSLSTARSIRKKLELTAYLVLRENGKEFWAPTPREISTTYEVRELIRTLNPALPLVPTWNKDVLTFKRTLDAVALSHGRLMSTFKKKGINYGTRK
jgi:hypothetical protein